MPIGSSSRDMTSSMNNRFAWLTLNKNQNSIRTAWPLVVIKGTAVKLVWYGQQLPINSPSQKPANV